MGRSRAAPDNCSPQGVSPAPGVDPPAIPEWQTRSQELPQDAANRPRRSALARKRDDSGIVPHAMPKRNSSNLIVTCLKGTRANSLVHRKAVLVIQRLAGAMVESFHFSNRRDSDAMATRLSSANQAKREFVVCR